MAGPNATHDPEEDKPLDPAVEHVRRRLVRFMVINLAILFSAVMAVVLALVYKSMRAEEEPSTEAPMASVPTGEVLAGEIPLPAGARIISHSVSGDRLILHLEFDDGTQAFHLYEMTGNRLIGRFQIVQAEE